MDNAVNLTKREYRAPHVRTEVSPSASVLLACSGPFAGPIDCGPVSGNVGCCQATQDDCFTQC
jgi:hypothetical protein